MPAMPRVSKKAIKIAYNILGVPNNMRKDKKKNRKVRERLEFEETTYSR